MTKDEELAKYVALIEQYKEQMSSLETQFSYLQAAITDYNKAKITLEHLGSTQNGTEILLPVGGGAFINGTVKNPSRVLFDIGGGIVTEKTSDDAIKKIDSRIEDLQRTQEKLLAFIQQLQTEATETLDKANKLLQEQ